MSNDQEIYVVDVVSNECSFYNMKMSARLLEIDYTELSCSIETYFRIEDGLMQGYVNSFNERYEDALFERGYVGFTIESDLTIYASYNEMTQLDKDRMTVILSNCRLRECDDKSGRTYGVSNTEFAREFNDHFAYMIDDFDEVCNFKVKNLRKL